MDKEKISNNNIKSENANIDDFFNILKKFVSITSKCSISPSTKFTILHATVFAETLTDEDIKSTLTYKFIHFGFNINDIDAFGLTPLHWACMYGNLEMIYLLVDHGANPNLKSLKGKLPYDLLDDDIKDEVFKYFNTYISSNEIKKNLSNLAFTLKETIEFLLHNDISFMTTPLHQNIKTSSDRAFDLIKRGFLVNIPDYDGLTPLHFAVSYQNFKVAKLLLENGANKDSLDDNKKKILDQHITI